MGVAEGQHGRTVYLWMAFVILLPYSGVFVYLIARSPKLSEWQDAFGARSYRATCPTM
jgi:hypothetical protein